MATVKSQAALTLVDLTDGFTVNLSIDSVSWSGGVSSLGSQQTASFTVTGYQGASEASNYSIGTPVCSDSANCTASVNATTKLVTVTVAAAATAGGSVTIPVTFTNGSDSITVNRTFTYNISLKGNGGAAGTNQATVFLYQRASSAPSAPSSAVTYTFATGALSAIPSGWSRSVPASDGNPCYVTQAVAIGTGATDSIAAADWSTPTKLVEDGADGADAIVLEIMPSTLVLKNNSGSATLTAYVTVGGAQATVASNGDVTYGGDTIGTVKWYKGSETTGTAANSITVTASQISNTMTVYAKLET